MYEFFEHTADVGLRVRAPDLDSLFEDAARGLFSLIVENLDEVREESRAVFRLEEPELRFLFFDWLNALLRRFETDRMLLSRFAVRVGDAGLEAEAYGETADAARHRLDHEVKAITYHGLRIERSGEGWLAEVVLDI